MPVFRIKLNHFVPDRQQGFTLIEILVAMTILAVVSVTFLSAMTTSSRAAIAADQMDAARVIAQAQIEWVKNQNFSSSGDYSQNAAIMNDYPGYTVEILASTAAQRDAFIQKITVNVYRHSKLITQLQDCKVKK
jgi:type II secretion system protein I